MTTPRGFRDRADDGLLTLIGDLPELVRNLVVAEYTSAKVWIVKTAKDGGMGAVWSLVALFVLFWTVPAIGAFAVIGLASWVPGWLAALIVVVAMLVVIALFALLALRRFRRLARRENPGGAVATDVKIVKDAGR